MAVPSAARGYESFGGTVGRTTAGSTPEWTYPPAAPQDAPNIVVVLVDDMGYSDIGPFGSEIETPTLDRLAANGIRFTNYHTTPLCSPSRASLLTGINAHRAGFGFVANADPGYPDCGSSWPTMCLPCRRPCATTGMPPTRWASGIWYATPR